MLNSNQITNGKILIVDDQQPNVLLLEQMLKKEGYVNVSSTLDPTMVSALHRTNCYDLILLDLQMPVMDGFAVLEQLAEIEAGGYVPVLAITAQPAHKLRALQAGAKDFVSKPFDLLEVQTRIHNMLEVRLLYQKLDNYNKMLENAVLARTAELKESESRFKSFAELSADWYWEQDRDGKFTRVYGPVFEMLGINADDMLGSMDVDTQGGWNTQERSQLVAKIALRAPFLDFVYSRVKPDGTTQTLQVSGEPIFDSAARFIGYRGIGQDITARHVHAAGHSA